MDKPKYRYFLYILFLFIRVSLVDTHNLESTPTLGPSILLPQGHTEDPVNKQNNDFMVPKTDPGRQVKCLSVSDSGVHNGLFFQN